MKTMTLREIHKLGVAYEKYERNPRRVGLSLQISRNSFSSVVVEVFLFAAGVAVVFEHCEADCEHCESILHVHLWFMSYLR